MVLPLLTSLEVRLTPRSLYLRNENWSGWFGMMAASPFLTT